MKTVIKTTSIIGLLSLSATALAGCNHTSHEAHHGSTEAPRSSMMAQHGGHGMSDSHDGQHGGMHGDHSQMHQGGMHGDHSAMHHGAGHTEHPFMQDHQRMMDDMHSLEITGDADYDFVRGMIPHHQGAIDMAETLLAQGSDAELLALAEAIIEAQKSEIAVMNAWLAAYGEPRPGNEAADIRAGYERANNRMMRDMNLASSGDINRDFVQGMIPHHEAAIDMAYILLRYSQDAELRALGEAVIREQEREIREMRAWLTR